MSVLDATRRRTGWFTLPVRRLDRLAADAVGITLHVPPHLHAVFSSRPGQHVVVRHRRPGGELRRAYSVCPPPGDPAALRVVVKRNSADGFGEYALTALRDTDHLELSAPAGSFALPGLAGAHHVLIAGGSGITPLAAMAAAILREDAACRVSLVHSVRTAATALLADEIAELKDAYVDRFTPLYVLTRESRESDLCTGRIDGARLGGLLAALGVTPGPRTTFAVCGPYGLLDTVRTTLTARGVAPEDIRAELFTAEGAPSGPAPAEEPFPPGRITAVVAGRASVVTMLPQDDTVLDAVLRARPEIPYACRDGVCGSCRAKVLAGAVSLGRQHALDARDLSAGYTLACRARPREGDLTLDFDA